MGKENGDTPYEVRSSQELGRYLVAARDLSPGDLVLTERPLVFGPKAMPDPETCMPCVGCYKPLCADAGERCSKCGWPVCSGNCPGLRDPRHHAAECNILSARPDCALRDLANYYRHDALLPLRCLLLKTVDPEKWKKLLEMQSHMECRIPGTEAYDDANEFIVEYLMNNFITQLNAGTKKKYLPDVSAVLLHKMCGIIDTNALEIRLQEGAELLSLYTNTCIMEHSCIPSTKHTFTQSCKNKDDIFKITVKVVVPLEKGSHITTMYSHALWGTQARRQHLKETKYFACKCQRCRDPTELGTYLSAMKCLGDGNACDGVHLPEDPLDDETEWACCKCNIKINNSQVNMLVSQMGEEVENVQMMGGSPIVLENVLCRLSTFLHPNHYHLYSIKHSLVQLYGRLPAYTSSDILDKKINMCRDLLVITNKLDPGNARLSLYNAILQHELHSALVMKLKINNNDTPVDEIKPMVVEAKSTIDKALDSLKDDLEETSGKRLYEVIAKSREEFVRFSKGKEINL